MEWTKTKTAIVAAIVLFPMLVVVILMIALLRGPKAGAGSPVADDQTLPSPSFSAQASAQSGHWPEAAASLAQAIKADPSEHDNWWYLMPLLIQSGKTAEYKTQCKAMLDRFGNNPNPMIAERTAKSCLLLPSAVRPADLTLVGSLADRALSNGTGSPWFHWFQFTKGLADYRQGRFTSALEGMDLAQKELAQSGDAARDMCEAETYFVSAMAHDQLKQPDEARAALARGLSIVQTRLPPLDGGNLGPVWYDTLTTHILMREAQKMIKDMPAAEQK